MTGPGVGVRRVRAVLAVAVAIVSAAVVVAGGGAAGAAGTGGGTAGRGGPRPGTLVAAFGTGGVVRTDYEGAPDEAADVVVDARGRIVVAGSWGRGTGDYWYTDLGLARYDRNGTLDPTFGDGGTVATDVFGGYDHAGAVVAQRDGSLLVAGSAFPVSGSDPAFVVARYRADGRLDPAFGDGGIVTTDVGYHDIATAAALQRDGKLVVAGWTMAPDQGHAEIVLVRYLADGSLDPTFGDGGIATAPFRPDEPSLAQAQDVVIRPDGSILTAGAVATLTSSDVAVSRFRPDGTLDTRFGDGGHAVVSASVDSQEDAVALQVVDGGRIVVLGSAESRWWMSRLRPDGRGDARFGDDGFVRSTVLGEPRDLLVQADGRLVVAGRSSPGDDHFDVTLARYHADGRRDRGFGVGGLVTTDIATSTDGAAAVATAPGGDLVVAGSTEPIPSTPPHSDVLVARYHAS